MSRSFGDKVGA